MCLRGGWGRSVCDKKLGLNGGVRADRTDSLLGLLLTPQSPPSSFFSELHPAWCLENTNLLGSHAWGPRKRTVLSGFMSSPGWWQVPGGADGVSSGSLRFPFSPLLQRELWFIREDEFN